MIWTRLRNIPAASIHKIKFDGDGTSKIGKDPKSADTAGPRYAETGFCRTSRSEYASCTSVDSARPPAPSWKDCSPPELFLRRAAARRQEPDGSKDSGTQSSRD